MERDEVQARLIELSDEHDLNGAEIAKAIGVSRQQVNHVINGRSSSPWARLERWAPLVGQRVVHHLVTREAAGAVRLILREISSLGQEDLRRVSRIVRLLPKISDRERLMLDHELDGWEALSAYDDGRTSEPQETQDRLRGRGHRK